MIFAKSAEKLAVGGMLAIERLRSGVTYNPLSRSLRVNPYPIYRELRERDPVHRSQLIGGWVLSRYDDVVSVLRDPRFSADDRNSARYDKDRARLIRAGILEPDSVDTPPMLRLDPPDHSRQRALVNKAFTPRVVKAMRTRVETIVKEQLDEIANGGLDVIRDLAYPLPVRVIAEMIGVPSEDQVRFKHWSDEVVLGLGHPSLEDIRRSNTASRELSEYFEKIAEQRRRSPEPDLLSALLAAEEAGDRLSSEELYANLVLLLVAGNETTTNLIGNGMRALLRHPEQLEALRADPDGIEGAVHELLRYDGPVQATSRIALEDLELHGRRIRRGQQVILLLGSANHDPEQFEEPERLDVARADAHRHLAFGYGAHYCVGAPLARLEAEVAIQGLLERYPSMKLAGDATDWNDNLILRGLRSLPVIL